MGLLGDGTVRHGSGLETGHDGIHALHFFQRDAFLRIFEIQKRADLPVVVLSVDQRRILLKQFIASFSGRLLQEMDRLRIVQMLFPGASLFMKTQAVQSQAGVQSQRIECSRMQRFHLFLDLFQADAPDAADRVGKIFVHHFFVDADRLKNLGTQVRLDRRNTHLGRRLHNTADDRLVVIVYCRVVIFIQDSLIDQVPDALLCQIRIDRAGAVSQQRCEMMYFPGFAGFQDDGYGGTFLGPDQMLLQRGHRQQRRDRHMVLIYAPVGQDQDIYSVPVSPVSFHKQPVDGTLQTGIFIIGDRKHFHLEAFLLHSLDLQQICVGQDRVVDSEHAAVLRFLFQQVSVLAHIDYRGSNDLFTDSVDRRIGHLREQLFEIIEQRLMMVGQRRQRHVDSHGRSSLGTIGRHAHDRSSHIFIPVAECFLKALQFFRRVLLDSLVGNLQFRKTYQAVIQPLTVRLAVRVRLLQLIVVDDPALSGIHQKHLARMQPLLHHDPGRVDIQHSHLGRKDQLVVGSHIISGRTQTVAVQYGAHHIAVGKQNRSGTVPGFHHGRIILIKIFLFLGHGPVVQPRLRNQDHDCQRQIHTAHHKEFQRIVQHGRIGTGSADRRKYFVKFSFQTVGFHRLLAGQHLVRISLDRIDLAVMYQETVRMRAFPAGKRIGGETGMHQRDGALIIRALQIREKLPQLAYQEHAFINQRPAGTGYYISVIVGLFKNPAGNVELPVKIQTACHIIRLRDKCLKDRRHLLQRLRSKHFGIGSDFSPSQKLHAFLLHNDLKHLFRLIAHQLILGKEKHTDAVFSLSAQLNAQLRALFFEKFMGDLYHDSHAVAGLAFRVFSGAVLQILYDAERIRYSLVGFDTSNIDHRADAAVVMFKTGIIHALRGTFHLLLIFHKR